MSATLNKVLEGIGLNPKEADVYLACLELAGGSNATIAKKTRLNRITNYEVLKRLVERGVVASSEERGVKRFTAIEPDVLIRQAEQRVAAAAQFLPDLMALTNTVQGKPKVQFYEGEEGIRSIYEQSLKAKTDILTFTSAEDVRKLPYLKEYVQERVRRNIRVRGFAADTPAGREEREIGKTVLRDVRLLPAEEYNVADEIMFYDDKMAIFSSREGVGLIIQSPSLSKSFRNIWDMLWKRTEKSSGLS